MKTTTTKITGISLLLLTFLAAAIGFAHPPKTKKSDTAKEQTLRLSGQIVKINKDRTFELVNDKGEHYLVHMNQDSSVARTQPIPSEKRILNYEDLFVGARVTFRADQLEQTYAASKPMPVAVR
ncbi:MAG TPA: hypothetical protein VFC63_13235 [Blastocatellia bacterium]|nr:hypothetical protein [Blastocatellia bacterium]